MAVSPVMKDAEPLLLNVGEDQYNLEEFPEESVALGESDYLEDQIEWSESFKWGLWVYYLLWALLCLYIFE